MDKSCTIKPDEVLQLLEERFPYCVIKSEIMAMMLNGSISWEAGNRIRNDEALLKKLSEKEAKE